MKEHIYMNKTLTKLLDDIKELHERKAHDYSKESDPYSNFKFAALLVAEFSNPVDQVFASLIGVKISRLSQLLGGKEPNNESIEDSFKDLTTYCALWTSHYVDTHQPRTSGKD